MYFLIGLLGFVTLLSVYLLFVALSKSESAPSTQDAIDQLNAIDERLGVIQAEIDKVSQQNPAVSPARQKRRSRATASA